MNKETIIIDGLTKQFKNILAVKNISFKIGKGKIIGLLGPNGCGKSTTIGMILGLIKPSSGTVVINGKNIEHHRTNLLEKMNFISPYVELPKKLTVEENLKVYGRLYGVKNLKHKISDLMEKLNLFDFKSRKTGELSSGQKNRVSLAKALINDPKYFFWMNQQLVLILMSVIILEVLLKTTHLIEVQLFYQLHTI